VRRQPPSDWALPPGFPPGRLRGRPTGTFYRTWPSQQMEGMPRGGRRRLTDVQRKA